MRWVQEADPDAIAPTDNIEAIYNFSHTFCWTTESRARGANLDSGIQNALNRWKKVEEARGKCPQFNMEEH